MNRGVFIQNSEVGDCALRLKLFVYDNVCGNHIVWGASKVTDVSVRHVKGQGVERGHTMRTALNKWSVASRALPSGAELSAQIEQAQCKIIGATKDDVLDAIFSFAKSKSLSRLTRPTIEAAYKIADENPRYKNPRTVWGMVNGLTEFSQKGHTDTRTELDAQAGRLLEMAF